MAYIRKKTIKGHVYYYLVEGVRVNGTVRQRVLAYLGAAEPSPRHAVLLKSTFKAYPPNPDAPAPAPGSPEAIEATKAEVYRSFALFGLEVRHNASAKDEFVGAVRRNAAGDADLVLFAKGPPLDILLHELGHVIHFNVENRAPVALEDDPRFKPLFEGETGMPISEECRDVARRVYSFEDAALTHFEMELEDGRSLSASERKEYKNLCTFFETYADTLEEGFANMFSLYLRDPERARARAPGLCTLIAGVIGDYPDLQSLVDRITTKLHGDGAFPS